MGKSIIKTLHTSLIVIVMCLLFSIAVHADTPVMDTDVSTPSDECVFLGLEGTFLNNAKEALDLVNEIRLEACNSGSIKDPRNPSRYLQPSDYVPIKWSSTLEKIARIRSAEAALTLYHSRINGKELWSINVDGLSFNGEVLAWNNSMNTLYGINQWYNEKEDWINNTGKQTGHYEMIINPSYTYMGISSFYSKDTQGFTNTTVGSFSKTTSNLDTSMLPGGQTVIQTVDVLKSEIQDVLIPNVYVGETSSDIKFKVRGSKLTALTTPTLVSKNTDVLRVENGKLKGVKKGSANLEITLGNYKTTKTVTVECNHNYTYSEPNDKYKITGTCSKCGDTKTVTAPSKLVLYWKNSTEAGNMYNSAIPSNNPVGSSLQMWINTLNGDDGYKELVITSSDEKVIKLIGGDDIIKSFLCIKEGTAKITVYPKYNTKLKKTFTVKVASGSNSNNVVIGFNGTDTPKPTTPKPSVTKPTTTTSKVVKKKNTVKIVTSSKTFKKKAVKKKTQSFKIKVKNLYKAKNIFKINTATTSKKARKYIKVSKAGTVVVKKGTPKGTYKVSIKVTAQESSKYTSATALKNIKIKVK